MNNIWIIRTGLCLGLAMTAAAQPDKDFQSKFTVDKAKLGVKGANPYFNLTPGYTLHYRHGIDTDTLAVLAETVVIDGVETRVIEDRETKNGKLAEVTRDYFAIDSETNDVYYFGEDVDVYRDGKVTGHGGSWRSGVNGAEYGLMMPGSPKAGQRFFQERAPGAGVDRAEVVSVSDKITTPMGKFENCVHVVETNALEPGVKDHKWYVAGVGQIKDEKMVLVKVTGK